MKLPSHRYSWRTWAWDAYLKLLQKSSWPIVVGPFTGEVGFEALYWQPFVAKIIDTCGQDRVFPICRGGSARWYGSSHGVELYAMRDPRDIRVAQRVSHAQRGYNKQDSVSDFDRQVIHDAADSLGLGERYHVVHPAWMYHRLASFWTGYSGLQDLATVTSHAKIQAPPLPPNVTLPESFAAVQFYARPTYPMMPMAQQFATATLQTIANVVPVVLLETTFMADDHPDVPMPLPPNVTRLSDIVATTPETNLWVKSAVIARSKAFVGTYGGLAQLALRLGVPSVSFYVDWGGTSQAHHQLSIGLSLITGVPYQVFRVMEIALTRNVLPLVQAEVVPQAPVAV